MPKSSQRDTDGHSQSSLTSEIWGSSIGEICGWVALLKAPELDGCTQPLVPWNGHSLGAHRAQRPLRAYERSSRAEPPLPLNREIPEDRRERSRGWRPVHSLLRSFCQAASQRSPCPKGRAGGRRLRREGGCHERCGFSGRNRRTRE